MSSIPGIDSRAPRAHRHEQRVVGVAERLAGLLLEALERLVDLLLEAVRERAVRLHVGDAGLGRDREAGRHALGAEDARHLGDVGALAAEQLAHVARALGEVVDELGRRRRPSQPAHCMPLGDAALNRTCAWYSSVSAIARSTCARAGSGACGRLGERPASAATRKRCASSPSGNEPASQPAQTTPPALGEKAPRCSASPQAAQAASSGRKPGRQQQLEPEGERLGAAGGRRRSRRAGRARGRAGCRRAGSPRSVEQPQHRLAGLRGALERGAPLAQGGYACTRLGLGDRAELAAALVQHEPHPEERLEPAAEPRLRAAHALRHRAHPPAVGRVEVQDAIASRSGSSAARSLRS